MSRRITYVELCVDCAANRCIVHRADELFNPQRASERLLLLAIYKQGEKMATELDNLKKAVADVQAAAAAEATRLEAIITSLRSGNISPIEVQAAADALEVVAANLNAIEAPAPAPADGGTPTP